MVSRHNRFNNSVTLKLKYIEKQESKRGTVPSNEPVGKIKNQLDNLQKGFEYPDEEYRILGLSKYWNIIEYFYPINLPWLSWIWVF
jgi:hypothetical protein